MNQVGLRISMPGISCHRLLASVNCVGFHVVSGAGSGKEEGNW